ncbi:hypothetical protein ACVXZZ_00185 [Staphylococcus aureus]
MKLLRYTKIMMNYMTLVDYREMKRDVLANRHQFGEAASLLETEIEKFEPRLEQYEDEKLMVIMYKRTTICS